MTSFQDQNSSSAVSESPRSIAEDLALSESPLRLIWGASSGISGNLLEIPVLGKLELESRGTPESLGGSPKKYFFMCVGFIILRDRAKEDVGNKNYGKLFFL